MSDAPPLEVSVVGGRTFDWDRMPPGMVEQYDALNRAGDALYDAGDKLGAKAKWEEATALVEPYEKKRKPLPTAPDPHPPELIPDSSEALAVYTSPDVVKVGDKPTPFAVHGKGSDDHNYSPDVRSNGQVVKHQNSRMTVTYGAEPGDTGVKSGTEGKPVAPTSSSPIVKVNGNRVQRHSDTCTLNNGNCPGEYVHVKSTEVNPAPGGGDHQDKSEPTDERGSGAKGWDGFYENSSEAQMIGDGLKRGREYLNDPSLALKDGRALIDAAPTKEQIVEFGQNVGHGAVEGAKYVWNNPGEAASGALNSGIDGLKGLWGGLTDAYDKGGVAQAGGHLAAAGLSVVNPFKKLKLAGKVADGLEDLGDVAKLKRKLDHDKAPGDGGARSTGKTKRTRNPCAHLAKGDPNGPGDYRGGSYEGTRGAGEDRESDHIPPKSVSPLSEGQSPAISKDKKDHRRAMSTGSSDEARDWRKEQQRLINAGRYRDAAAMDYHDTRRVARETGDQRKYNQALKERSAYQRCLEKHGLLPGKKK
ncbi:DUF4150 domain-containing protein [Mesorhizobium sp. RP14(2022)]|uniref:DUF4150 domain-containing protein n=1 Tax=Mesorhizobium liriopis TaxID=2953882 RepID=A0ABT1CAA2_9HYPH|nr:PAAR-like domain-containing protein [Mesorhizobium liriopis]MCO6051747.1 DUF4150 domain-containing protein [Mesorhizobium liriopis]